MDNIYSKNGDSVSPRRLKVVGEKKGPPHHARETWARELAKLTPELPSNPNPALRGKLLRKESELIRSGPTGAEGREGPVNSAERVRRQISEHRRPYFMNLGEENRNKSSGVVKFKTSLLVQTSPPEVQKIHFT